MRSLRGYFGLCFFATGFSFSQIDFNTIFQPEIVEHVSIIKLKKIYGFYKLTRDKKRGSERMYITKFTASVRSFQRFTSSFALILSFQIANVLGCQFIQFTKRNIYTLDLHYFYNARSWFKFNKSNQVGCFLC